MFHMLMTMDPTSFMAAAGTFWDVLQNITNDISNHKDTVAELIGIIVFVVGIVLTGMGMWSQSRRGAHLGWGIASMVVGASLGLAGFAGILNNMFQNTGKQAVGGVIVNFLTTGDMSADKLLLLSSIL